VSQLGVGIDRQISETMISSGILFVVAQLVLAFFVWRFADNNDQRKIKIFPGGATPMVVGAILIVGAEILALTLVGTKIWASIYVTPADPHSLKIDVQAEQFAYYFRYPGPDGKFGAIHPELIDESSGNFFGLDPAHDTAARDDIVAATLAVPVNTPILLELHSKDVNHAFYVPELRIQQDFVPGLVIPLHFTAIRLTKSEIVCTQLCGLGHYNMRAYLEVMSAEDFKKWLNDQSAQ
jgi:cytochrome c oxidase subunit II